MNEHTNGWTKRRKLSIPWHKCRVYNDRMRERVYFHLIVFICHNSARKKNGYLEMSTKILKEVIPDPSCGENAGLIALEALWLSTMKTLPSGFCGDAITSLSMGNFTMSEPETKQPNVPTDQTFSMLAHVVKFHSNPSSSFWGNAIARKILDGR